MLDNIRKISLIKKLLTKIKGYTQIYTQVCINFFQIKK